MYPEESLSVFPQGLVRAVVANAVFTTAPVPETTAVPKTTGVPKTTAVADTTEAATETTGPCVGFQAGKTCQPYTTCRFACDPTCERNAEVTALAFPIVWAVWVLVF